MAQQDQSAQWDQDELRDKLSQIYPDMIAAWLVMAFIIFCVNTHIKAAEQNREQNPVEDQLNASMENLENPEPMQKEDNPPDPSHGTPPKAAAKRKLLIP